jgi:hypothetical protein
MLLYTHRLRDFISLDPKPTASLEFSFKFQVSNLKQKGQHTKWGAPNGCDLWQGCAQNESRRVVLGGQELRC